VLRTLKLTPETKNKTERGSYPAASQLPALRERVDDIPVLVEYLIERYAKKAGKKLRNIRKTTLDQFQAYDWPGNIRELQNVIERASVGSNTEPDTPAFCRTFGNC